mmetsp:Transcript_38167/g.62142  ORF Transcript_38167/g.62142 Transcript_38167/m.62142 type:complete len:89 (-) Transcript_38167:205-471(-)
MPCAVATSTTTPGAKNRAHCSPPNRESEFWKFRSSQSQTGPSTPNEEYYYHCHHAGCPQSPWTSRPVLKDSVRKRKRELGFHPGANQR